MLAFLFNLVLLSACMVATTVLAGDRRPKPDSDRASPPYSTPAQGPSVQYRPGSRLDLQARGATYHDLQSQNRVSDSSIGSVLTATGDMQRAIERARAENGGKVLSADRIRFQGQDAYRVKLLTPTGRVRVVQVNPLSRSHHFYDRSGFDRTRTNSDQTNLDEDLPTPSSRGDE